MPTPEDYALQAETSASNALVSANLANDKAVLSDQNEVASLQYSLDSYTYMLNSLGSSTDASQIQILTNQILNDITSKVNSLNSLEQSITTLTNQISSLSTNVTNNANAVSIAQNAVNNALATITNLVNQQSSIYLGSQTTPPVTTVVGSQYWNSIDNLLYTWNGTSWVIPTVSLDKNIDAGTATSPVGKIQLRRGASTSWTLANITPALGELCIETDTGYIKVGNGITAWVDLPYIQIPKESVVGFNNVTNTSDADKPVSTLQADAITLTLNTAKAYIDSSLIGVIRDVGNYSPGITNAYPVGTIIQGNTYTCIDSGTINGLPIEAGYSLRALVDNPSQSDTDWCITATPEVQSKPYILVYYIPGLVLNDYRYPAHIFTTSVTFKADNLSKAISQQRAINDFTFTISRGGIDVGTLIFAAGSNIGTVSFTADTTFVAGNTLELKSQITPDALLGDISISLYGTYNL
jgi:uncharacterized protein YoxC